MAPRHWYLFSFALHELHLYLYLCCASFQCAADAKSASQLPSSHLLLSKDEAEQLRDRFRKAAEASYMQALRDQVPCPPPSLYDTHTLSLSFSRYFTLWLQSPYFRQEAVATRAQVPWWMGLLLLILGWNEFWAVCQWRGERERGRRCCSP